VVEEIVSYIDVLRPKKKAMAPIDRADIARCRSKIELALRTHRLPLPRAGPAGLRANELVHNRAAAALPTNGAQEEAQRRAIIDSACSAR
jgi:hypothetical protein